MSVTHRYESPITDQGDPDLVGPDEWNDEHLGGVLSGPDYWRIDDECYNGGSIPGGYGNGAITVFTSGGVLGNGVASAGHPGVLALQTGTGSSGRCSLASPNQWVIGGGIFRFGCVFQMRSSAGNALSDGTNRYTLYAGVFNSSTGAATAGIGFRYSDNLSSGNWEAISLRTSGGGTDSIADTGVAHAMATWTRLEFEINAAGTEILYYINGTLEHTETTNIETTAAMALHPMGIFKSLGTSSRFVDLDAFWFEQILTTPR